VRERNIMANYNDYELTLEVLGFVLGQWERDHSSLNNTLDQALRMLVMDRTPVPHADPVNEGYHGLDKLMCMLLDRGAASNKKDGAGQSALFYAHRSCPHMLPALRDAYESVEPEK
jgi:hypothetical protein